MIVINLAKMATLNITLNEMVKVLNKSNITIDN